MKRVSKLFYIMLALCGVSCSSYLDINDNPNNPTVVSAPLVLNNALVTTARGLNLFNSYGGQIGGTMANAGGYGGFNELITYAYTASTYDVWNGTYDNLEDYQYIANQVAAQMAKGDSSNVYYYAVAKIMRAHNFQLIVDQYNNAPYSKALLGAANLTPQYDDAKVIYKGLADELDEAIKMLNRGDLMAVKNPLSAPIDNNSSQLWHQFANTLKLKLIVRANYNGNNVSFTNTTFDNVGFLTTDFKVNPGFKRDNNRQSPAWNTWAFSYTLTAGNKAWMPTKYVMAFYDGTTLSDVGRGTAMYYLFPATGTNQLGLEGTGIPKSPTGSFWYPGADRTAAPGNSTGVLKGPSASYPIMIAAESYLLQAEAAERGIITSSSTPQQLFDKGVTASFTYLYTKEDGTISGNPAGDATTYQYITNNNKLTNYSKCTTLDERMQAIITQKYIALNMVASHEGWNEYRRTGYPLSATSPSVFTPTNSFASLYSARTTVDKLPTRIPYPASEAAYNPANLPGGISLDQSKIFWAK